MPKSSTTKPEKKSEKTSEKPQNSKKGYDTVKVKINQAALIRVVVLLSVVGLVASGWAWWHFVWSNSQRVFDRMLSNSMQTRSVTRRLIDDTETRRDEEIIKLYTTGVHMTQSLVTTTGKGAQDGLFVQEESLQTLNGNYVRYNTIKSPKTEAETQPYNYNAILGIWAKRDSTGSAEPADAFYEIGFAPFANLQRQDREALLKQVKQDNVYKITGEVKKNKLDGRSVYSYNVSISPTEYIKMRQQLGKFAGLQAYKDVDLSRYANLEPAVVTMDVDILSGTLRRVVFNDGIAMDFMAHNASNEPPAVPENAISMSELNSKLQ